MNDEAGPKKTDDNTQPISDALQNELKQKIADNELEKKNEKRQTARYVYKELIETEKTFVNNIEDFIRFYDQLLSDKKITTPENIQRIIEHYRIIMENGKEFLKILDKPRPEQLIPDFTQGKDETQPSVKIINSILTSNELTKHIQFFLPVLSNYNEISKYFSPESQKNTGIKELWFKYCKDKKIEYSEVSSILILPVQRGPRYTLLIEQLYKNLDNNAIIEKAHTLIKTQCHFNNSQIKLLEKVALIYKEEPKTERKKAIKTLIDALESSPDFKKSKKIFTEFKDNNEAINTKSLLGTIKSDKNEKTSTRRELDTIFLDYFFPGIRFFITTKIKDDTKLNQYVSTLMTGSNNIGKLPSCQTDEKIDAKNKMTVTVFSSPDSPCAANLFQAPPTLAVDMVTVDDGEKCRIFASKRMMEHIQRNPGEAIDEYLFNNVEKLVEIYISNQSDLKNFSFTPTHKSSVEFLATMKAYCEINHKNIKFEFKYNENDKNSIDKITAASERAEKIVSQYFQNTPEVEKDESLGHFGPAP